MMYSLYGHYHSGFLPVAGGIIDQPAIFVQSVNVIRGEIALIDDEKSKKKKR